MVEVPVQTVEKPLTAIDYCVPLASCQTIDQVGDYAQRCPIEIRQDERFTRAVARRLGEIKERKRA